MKKQWIAILWLPFALPLPVLAGPPVVCSFRVADADDRPFSQENLRGRVTILFYETKDGSEKSRKLRDDLNRSYAAQAVEIRSAMQRMGIVNAESASTLVRPFWRSAIRDRALKEGVPIYIDWDGAIGLRCGLHNPSGTTVALFDRNGRLRLVLDGTKAQAESLVGEIARLVAEH